MNQTCIVPANSRGGRILLHDGFRYARKSKSATQIRWICTVYGCRAYAYTNLFDVDDNDPHIAGKRICKSVTFNIIEIVS